MKKLALALLICSASAFATSVTYSTAAVFSGPDLGSATPPCPAGFTNCLVNGTANIVFQPQASTTVDSPTNIALGQINASGGLGAFVGDTIVLTITQTVPGPTGSSATSSTVTGTITSTSDSIDLTFAPTHFTINNVPYVLQTDYFLVAPNTFGGVTSLQGNVGVGAPEPMSLGLMGVSLLGLGVLVRRRAKK